MATERQLTWLEDYLQTGDAIGAVSRVYPDVSEASRPARASQLKARFAEEIDKRIRDGYKLNAPIAAKIIMDLAKGANQESVKLKAAQDILSRAGHDSALVIEDKTDTRTYNELQAQLKDLIGQLSHNELQAIAPALENLKGGKNEETRH